MKRGPSTTGSSGIGRGSDFVPAPHTSGPKPRRTAASPMVAMTTAITGRPISFRSMTRSSAKPKPIMPARPTATASQSGAPQAAMATATTKPAIITNSPWAKLIASVAL